MGVFLQANFGDRAELDRGIYAIVENPKLDLGRVVRGQVAEGTFRVRNLGAATLHIKQAKPG